jgi:ATP-binding cassette subfamily F protein uup
LIGELSPDSGTVKLGTQLSITYFDQLRRQLNPDESVVDAIAQGQEIITIGGSKKHIMSYLNDFLFPPQRARSPIKSLSGGERNRVLLAQLFTKPANVLILDEPTNDLDVESLELLEELLTNYQGTLLLVSHDRYFLDNVVTSTIVFEGDGQIKEYVGGYQDWLNQRPVVTPPVKKVEPTTPKPNSPPRQKTSKLNYNEQRELAALPERIEALETQLADIQNQINHPNFYRGERDKINQTLSKLTALEAELKTVYARWEALESG